MDEGDADNPDKITTQAFASIKVIYVYIIIYIYIYIIYIYIYIYIYTYNDCEMDEGDADNPDKITQAFASIKVSFFTLVTGPRAEEYKSL